ncbi:hypothetical protein [Streptomyces sp. NPDC054962]
MEQLAEDPDIFCIPGDEAGVVGFSESWMCAVRALTSAGQRAGGVQTVAL